MSSTFLFCSIFFVWNYGTIYSFYSFLFLNFSTTIFLFYVVLLSLHFVWRRTLLHVLYSGTFCDVREWESYECAKCMSWSLYNSHPPTLIRYCMPRVTVLSHCIFCSVCFRCMVVCAETDYGKLLHVQITSRQIHIAIITIFIIFLQLNLKKIYSWMLRFSVSRIVMCWYQSKFYTHLIH